MALVHPLAFLLRRVLYAFVILFFVKTAAFYGVLLLLLTCLMMMGFILVEVHWEEQLINSQHLVNECFFYILCISLLLFSGVITDTRQSLALGWLMISAISALIFYNVIVILYDTVSYGRLLLIRNRLRIKRAMAQFKAKTWDKIKARKQKKLDEGLSIRKEKML